MSTQGKSLHLCAERWPDGCLRAGGVGSGETGGRRGHLVSPRQEVSSLMCDCDFPGLTNGSYKGFAPQAWGRTCLCHSSLGAQPVTHLWTEVQTQVTRQGTLFVYLHS